MEVLVCREVDRPDKSAYANVQGVPRAIQLDLVLFSNSTPVNTKVCLFYTSACLLYSNRMQLMFYWCCKMFIRKLFSSVINIHFINEIEKLHCCAIPHSTAQMLSQPCRDWQGPTLPRKSTTGPKYSSSNGPNNLQTSSTWQFCFFF